MNPYLSSKRNSIVLVSFLSLAFWANPKFSQNKSDIFSSDKNFQTKQLTISSYVPAKKREPNHDLFAVDDELDAIIDNFDSDHPLNLKSNFISVVGDDGKLLVLYSPKKTFEYSYVLKFSKTLTLEKEIKVKRLYPHVGGFTKGDDGEYYILYGRQSREIQNLKSCVKLVKYSSEFQVKSELDIDTSKDGYDVLAPFNSGNSRILFANGKIGIHFAKIQFRNDDGLNHQASLFLQVDAKSWEVDSGASTNLLASHSFAQHLIHDGEDFVTLDMGDWNPRALCVSKNLQRRNIFTYTAPGGKFYMVENRTFTDVGGIVSSGDSYIVTGIADDDTTRLKKVSRIHDRLFALKIAKDFVNISQTSEDGEPYRIRNDLVISEGETSEIFEYEDRNGEIRKQQNVGVKWFTPSEKTALNPKIIKIHDDRFGILYLDSFPSTNYITYFEIDSNLQITKKEKRIGEVRFKVNQNTSSLGDRLDHEKLWDQNEYVFFNGNIIWFQQILEYQLVETKSIQMNVLKVE